MSAQPKPQDLFTEDEYLAIEQSSEVKHEFVDGQIFAMAGASQRHNEAAAEALALLRTQLRGKPCTARGSDQRLKVEATGMQSYPDVLVACPPLSSDPRNPDTLLDATVIVEVLSPSTAEYDRTGKFLHFRRLPSLRHYVLVSQDRVTVEHRRRGEGGEWSIEVLATLEDTVRLDAIECELPLAQLYERLDLDPSLSLVPGSHPDG